MSSLDYPRGSEWRKWDLHVHTPYSALKNDFGNNFDEYATNLLLKAIKNEISVIGITDYFSIEGYKQIKELLSDNDRLQALIGTEFVAKAKNILFLPNIELRLSVLVKRRDGTDSRVNYHVIFSNEIEPSIIEDHFFRELKFTAECNPGSKDERWSLTLENLRELGKTLILQHQEFKGNSDLFVGMMNAVVSHEDVTTVLESQPSRFKDRYLIIVPADEDLSTFNWKGQGHHMRKTLIQKSHMIFSPNTNTRAFCLGKKHTNVQDFKDEFKSLKPCVHGSDSHCYDSLFEPAEKRYLWIKADPTFQGLRQLLNEPEKRIFIGEEPHESLFVKRNSTKYINEIKFERTKFAKEEEVWFSGTVPLNSGLVAIIGNKGSGKSALADILALLGYTHASSEFSFLNTDRFLDRKKSLGDMFCATVTWNSGHEVPRVLSENSIDPTSVELVKYIPQNYLETICSELKATRETQFYHELMEVIFSHVSDENRLNTETLEELIDYLTEEKEKRINQLLSELNNVNEAIVAMEYQRTEEHRKSLEAQLMQRLNELKAHEETKPSEVNEPEEDIQTQEVMKKINLEIEELQSEIQELEIEIESKKAIQKRTAFQIAAADKLLFRIDNLERYLNTFYNESSEDCNVLGLDIKNIVILKVDSKPVLDIKNNAIEINSESRELLDPSKENSLEAQLGEIKKNVNAKKLTLDEPNRKYQNYLLQLGEWQKKYDEIYGSTASAGSINGLKDKIQRLENLPERLGNLKNKRKDIVKEIYNVKIELLENYRELYDPVQDFINNHPISQEYGALQFFASIAVDGFDDNLLDMINKIKIGSFQGEQEGRERLKELISSFDFSSEADVQAFLVSVQEHLDFDMRGRDKKEVQLRDQLRQKISPEDVYNFIYGLSYLKPRFELRWHDKPLDQLSPGERGNLLLIFYLLIDKRTVPLIIDQPEENLDNQTIANMLVPAIKYAKEHRQIIIVTHNPNLAVVCDADQIIHSHLDKTNGNKVVYTTGSIENPTITKLLVDVLEGTKPAFDLRDAKYDILER